ncbi:MAG: helix-turn-helix transcriptional regulator [Actinomycetia bacterium]|nr:helix-turn-helix transcriptional regulator [Actinomycetes bacterium]
MENLSESLGDYLRQQRTSARLSLRQLADTAGVSNPYLSQIERGLKKPSAEILQELAKGLQISAETLYVKAGILDERTVSERRPWDVEAAIEADTDLSERQKGTLIDIYRSFIDDEPRVASRPSRTPETRTRASATKKAATKNTASKKAATTKTAATKTTTTSTTKKAAATKKATTATRTARTT